MKLLLFISIIHFSVASFGQNEFDKKVSELFFHLPEYGGIFEMRYALLGDTTFFNIKEPKYDNKTNRIKAEFAYHPLMHFMMDTSYLSYIFYDSVKVYKIRNIHLSFKESQSAAMDNQYQELFDLFEPLSYMWKENPDYDKFKGESYTFYSNARAYSAEVPRLTIHYNLIPGRNGKEGVYTMSIDYTEEY